MNDVIKYDAKARSPCTLTPELQKMFTMDGLMDGGLTCAPQNHADIQNGIDKQWIWSYDSINSYDDGALRLKYYLWLDTNLTTSPLRVCC